MVLWLSVTKGNSLSIPFFLLDRRFVYWIGNVAYQPFKEIVMKQIYIELHDEYVSIEVKMEKMLDNTDPIPYGFGQRLNSNRWEELKVRRIRIGQILKRFVQIHKPSCSDGFRQAWGYQ